MKRQNVDAFLDTVSSKNSIVQELGKPLEGCEDRSAATVEFARKAG